MSLIIKWNREQKLLRHYVIVLGFRTNTLWRRSAHRRTSYQHSNRYVKWLYIIWEAWRINAQVWRLAPKENPLRGTKFTIISKTLFEDELLLFCYNYYLNFLGQGQIIQKWKFWCRVWYHSMVDECTKMF